jgi:hypothetical protein
MPDYGELQDGPSEGNLKPALEYAVELSKKEEALVTAPGEEVFSRIKLHDLQEFRKRPPRARGLRVSTLDGFLGALEEAGEVKIVVVNPTLHVVGLGSLDEEWRDRETLAEARSVTEDPACLEQWMGAESFNIMVQRDLVDDAARKALLAITGNLAESEESQTDDDGASQRVQISKGARITWQTAPNPHRLTPYRTFPELEPLPADFILRLRPGGGNWQIALFEVRRGAWKQAAIDQIVEYLDAKIDGLPVVG